MILEFLRRKTSSKRRDVVKCYFLVSELSDLNTAVEKILRNVQLSEIMRFDDNSWVGIEVYSNVNADENNISNDLIYLPMRRKKELNSQLLIKELDRVTQSVRVFLNLEDSFQIVISMFKPSTAAV